MFLKTTLLVCSILIPCPIFAQDWTELREKGENLYEIKKSYEADFKGKELPKGQGHKQFHRWFNFTEPRAYQAATGKTYLKRMVMRGVSSRSKKIKIHSKQQEIGSLWGRPCGRTVPILLETEE
jgi:hypothetical protein